MEQINEILKKARISAAWENSHGNWKKEDFTNLFELVKQEGIEITKKENCLLIRWDYGQQKHTSECFLEELEEELYIMFAQSCLISNKKTKFITRFGVREIGQTISLMDSFIKCL